MKNIISLLFFIVLLPMEMWPQKSAPPPSPGVMIYLDAKLEECKKKNAVFFRKIENDGENGWLAMVYFVGGELKMQGHYTDQTLETPHGDFAYYYQNGQIESKGSFENGAKIGVWERFNPNGSPKAERYYSGYKFGDEPVYDPDEFPEFVGGNAALDAYLNKNLQYPEVALINRVEGEVYVTFVINKVGQVKRVMVRNSLDPHLDKEAIRLIKNMPDWIPGKKDGNLVNTQMAIPIQFKL